MRHETTTLKAILSKVRQEVIEPIQKGNDSEIELEIKKIFFERELSKIWKNQKISEENKFKPEDIFGYPIEVMYLLYCFQIKFKYVIDNPKRRHEYCDYFLERYPNIKFDGNIESIYEEIKKMST